MKNIIKLLLFFMIIGCIIYKGIERFNKIENGEMILINHNGD